MSHTFTPGAKYVVLHQSETQRRPRRSCMTFLGEDQNGDLQWNARPEGGTQTLRPSNIVGWVRADDDAKHFLNHIIN